MIIYWTYIQQIQTLQQIWLKIVNAIKDNNINIYD